MKKRCPGSRYKRRAEVFSTGQAAGDQAGNMVNSNELSNTLQMSGPTVDNYNYIMQKSFIVNLLTPFYGNLRKEITKMPKVYFSDNGLRNALLNNFSRLTDRSDKGALLENSVYNRLRKLYDGNDLHFWRTADDYKVDFVVEQGLNKGLAYELKYNDTQFKLVKYKKFKAGYPDTILACINKEAFREETVEVIRL